jgi:Uncharacterized protein conserved in bacteria (DUF2255).
MPSGSFDPALLERLRSAEEVEIETCAAPGAPIHCTVIWVVVDGQDHVLIRSYLGPGARWYREATAQASCVLHVSGESVSVAAVPARDGERIGACSRGYLAKYARHRATPQMLDETNLPTTLELLPR